MTSQDYWQMFIETGAPELYLLYSNTKKLENTNVFDNTSSGTPGYNL